MPARYTCHGAGTWPALSWSAVPAGTKELALFFIHEGSNGTPIDWAVAGLKPTLTGLDAGKLPAGALVGKNRLHKPRYSVCPPRKHSRQYLVALYALSHRLGAKPGFDGAAALARSEKHPKVALLLFY